MNLIRVILVILAAIALIAASDGVAEDQNRDRTGSPDGSNTCVQCHNSSAFNPAVTITVRDSDGQEVDAYQADSLYDVRVMVSSLPFPSVFGFQATALFTDGNDAGQFSDPGPAVQLEEVNTPTIPSRHIVEHSQPSPVGLFTFKWTAPNSSQEVIFYASGNACNGDGDSSGDTGANSSKVLAADVTDGIYDRISLLNRWEINVSEAQLTIDHALINQLSQVIVYDLKGQLVMRVDQRQIPLELNRQSLHQGIYIVYIQSPSGEHLAKVYLP